MCVLFLLSFILGLTNIFLSNALYKQLLVLGIPSLAAIGLALLFSFFFCILVASLGLLLDTIMNLRKRTPESSPALDMNLGTRSRQSSPALEPPPPYCLVREEEEGELPTYEEATMK